MIGQRFDRLIVIAFHDRNPQTRKLRWLCQCDCGKTKLVFGNNLRRGNTKSCGCLQKEITVDRSTKHGHTNKTAVSGTYHSWREMKSRCYNPKRKFYKHYGGRGITVCDRWLESFDNFLADMGERPNGKSIDRIDTNGNYEPNNCRWATQTQQIHNRRT